MSEDFEIKLYRYRRDESSEALNRDLLVAVQATISDLHDLRKDLELSFIVHRFSLVLGFCLVGHSGQTMT